MTTMIVEPTMFLLSLAASQSGFPEPVVQPAQYHSQLLILSRIEGGQGNINLVGNILADSMGNPNEVVLNSNSKCSS